MKRLYFTLSFGRSWKNIGGPTLVEGLLLDNFGLKPFSYGSGPRGSIERDYYCYSTAKLKEVEKWFKKNFGKVKFIKYKYEK